MKVVNAVALLSLLVFVALDASYLLPRLQVLQLRSLVVHSVFDGGALIAVIFNAWCMLLRGRPRASAQIKLLASLSGQVFLLAAIAVFALDPWTTYVEAHADPGWHWSVLASIALLLVPVALSVALLRWSLRLTARAARPGVDRGAAEDEEEEEEEEEEEQEEAIDAPFLPLHIAKAEPPEPPRRRREIPVIPPPPSVEVHAAAAAPDWREAIPRARASVAAILRVRQGAPRAAPKKGRPRPAKYEAAIVGSAFCVVADRCLVTAHHVLNNHQSRRAQDRFYAVVAPGNGADAFHFPVVGFALEDAALDLAVLQIGPCAVAGGHVAALPIAAEPVADGSAVLAVGFPAPPIAAPNVDAQGNYLGGKLPLASRVNRGILSAQYVDADGGEAFEFNFGWHHGEAGGPILRLDRAPAVFALMQGCRPIQGPRGGIMDGPHQGRPLKGIEQMLRELGAEFV